MNHVWVFKIRGVPHVIRVEDGIVRAAPKALKQFIGKSFEKLKKAYHPNWSYCFLEGDVLIPSRPRSVPLSKEVKKPPVVKVKKLKPKRKSFW